MCAASLNTLSPFHSFADIPTHAVPQALAIALELAISLLSWSNIDNWHAECVQRYVQIVNGIKSNLPRNKIKSMLLSFSFLHTNKVSKVCVCVKTKFLSF